MGWSSASPACSASGTNTHLFTPVAVAAGLSRLAASLFPFHPATAPEICGALAVPFSLPGTPATHLPLCFPGRARPSPQPPGL